MRLDQHAEISRRVATTGHPFPDECANVIVAKLPEDAIEALLHPPEQDLCDDCVTPKTCTDTDDCLERQD